MAEREGKSGEGVAKATLLLKSLKIRALGNAILRYRRPVWTDSPLRIALYLPRFAAHT